MESESLLDSLPKLLPKVLSTTLFKFSKIGDLELENFNSKYKFTHVYLLIC